MWNDSYSSSPDVARQEKEGTPRLAFQKHVHYCITESMVVFQDRARKDTPDSARLFLHIKLEVHV